MDTHPRYFDIFRDSQYSQVKRDHKRLKFRTQDPLWFDHESKRINGGINRVLLYKFIYT